MDFAVKMWCMLLAVLQETHPPETISHCQSRSIFLPCLAPHVPLETPLEEEMKMHGQIPSRHSEAHLIYLQLLASQKETRNHNSKKSSHPTGVG